MVKAARPNPKTTKLEPWEDRCLMKLVEEIRHDTYGCNAVDLRRKARMFLRAVKAGQKINPEDFRHS